MLFQFYTPKSIGNRTLWLQNITVRNRSHRTWDLWYLYSPQDPDSLSNAICLVHQVSQRYDGREKKKSPWWCSGTVSWRIITCAVEQVKAAWVILTLTFPVFQLLYLAKVRLFSAFLRGCTGSQCGRTGVNTGQLHTLGCRCWVCEVLEMFMEPQPDWN